MTFPNPYGTVWSGAGIGLLFVKYNEDKLKKKHLKTVFWQKNSF
jgi:hypothetical protein